MLEVSKPVAHLAVDFSLRCIRSICWERPCVRAGSFFPFLHASRNARASTFKLKRPVHMRG